MNREWRSSSEEETSRIGTEIAEILPEDGLIYLSGDLGAGKTALVRAIATALGANPHDVASPSFNLVHEYPIGSGPSIFHVDGYRLSDNRREWLEIGIDEIIRRQGLKFIEWPKRRFDEFGEATIEIEIAVEEDDTRVISLVDNRGES